MMEGRRPALRAVRLSEPFEASTDAGSYRIEVVREAAALQALAPEWTRLTAEAEITHPFLSHEWLCTWWDCFGAGKTLHVILVRAGARLVGVAPLVRSEERMYGVKVRCLHTPYNPHVPRYEFIALGDQEGVHCAIWQHLRDTSHEWDALRLSQVPVDAELMRRLPAMAAEDDYLVGTWRGERSPHLLLGGDFEDYQRGLGRAHRKNVRSRLKRLEKLGAVDIEVICEDARLDELLTEGFRIEAAAWKGDNGTAIVCQPEVERFYRTLAQRVAPHGRLRLFFLTVNGARVAFSYALQYRNRIYSLKLGYDPGFRRYSPSTVMCYLMLRHAFECGLEEYDFLGVDEPWKLEWSPKVRIHEWLFVLPPRWRGRWIAALKFRWLPRLRQSRLHAMLRGRATRHAAHTMPDDDSY